MQQSDKSQGHSSKPFQPFIPASQSPAEVTTRSILLGIAVALVFGLANAYLGLKVGMTVSASIPAAVISMAILRMSKNRASVLENNIVQGMGSAGESLAAGIIFTVPAFFIWSANSELKAQGYNFDIAQWQILALAILGGALGVLLMIPLRRFLVEKEHGKLKYPEGTACAEIIKAGDQGGSRAKLVFTGIGVGVVYKVLMSLVKCWPEAVDYDLKGVGSKAIGKGGTIGIDATPALLAVGYIIGPQISAMMLSGAVLGYLAIGPLLAFIGQQAPDMIVAPGNIPLSQMDPGQLRNFYIKYLGVGAVTLGGFVSLMKSFPIIIQSFRQGFRQLVGKKADQEKVERTNYDLPMKWVLLGVLGIILAVGLLPGTGLPWVGVILAVVFGFFFVVVAARIVGLVGSSSMPVSGMTISTLIVTCLVLVGLGFFGPKGMIAAMMVGTIVCVAVSMSGDISQDLKTGFLLGGTPIRMQLTTLIGMAAPALVMGFMLFYLRDTFGFVEGQTGRAPMLAPQANVMATVVSGIMNGNLPWAPIIVGAFLALSVELLGIGALPFAIGLYLPLNLSTPIMLGGIVAWIIGKKVSAEKAEARNMQGVLFSSGLVAGDALMGVVVAFLIGIFGGSYAPFYDAHDGQFASLTASFGPWLSLILFSLLAVLLYRVSVKETKGLKA